MAFELWILVAILALVGVFGAAGLFVLVRIVVDRTTSTPVVPLNPPSPSLVLLQEEMSSLSRRFEALDIDVKRHMGKAAGLWRQAKRERDRVDEDLGIDPLTDAELEDAEARSAALLDQHPTVPPHNSTTERLYGAYFPR